VPERQVLYKKFGRIFLPSRRRGDGREFGNYGRKEKRGEKRKDDEKRLSPPRAGEKGLKTSPGKAKGPPLLGKISLRKGESTVQPKEVERDPFPNSGKRLIKTGKGKNAVFEGISIFILRGPGADKGKKSRTGLPRKSSEKRGLRRREAKT